jgi:hypothetical protein
MADGKGADHINDDVDVRRWVMPFGSLNDVQ